MTEFQLVNPENPDLCDFSKSQWYTPPELAQRIVRWALKPWANNTLRVLEPSAGHGALVLPLVNAGCTVTAVDIDPANADFLASFWPEVKVFQADFVAHNDWPTRFDLAVMNPPFEDGQAEEHVLHALKFASRVTAHVPLTTLAGKERREGLWSTAYLKRLVIHSTRPKYSGCKTGGQTDMCTIDVTRRYEPKLPNVACTGVDVEFWP